jgi:hypothetical protein
MILNDQKYKKQPINHLIEETKIMILNDLKGKKPKEKNFPINHLLEKLKKMIIYDHK